MPFYWHVSILLLLICHPLKSWRNKLQLFYVKQLPVLPPQAYSTADILFIVPRVLELTYCSYDMAPWAQDIWASGDGSLRAALLVASDCARGIRESWIPPAAELDAAPWDPARLPPFPWNADRRARLRAQLDARYARLYGLTAKNSCTSSTPHLSWERTTHPKPSVSSRTTKCGTTAEYRTMRLVLEAWDEGRGDYMRNRYVPDVR